MDWILTPVVEYLPKGVTPNMLTWSRIWGIPVLWGLYTVEPLVAVILYAILCVTDALDGASARYRGISSSHGKILDERADKIFVAGVAIILIVDGVVPYGFNALFMCVVVITFREFVVTILRSAFKERAMQVPSIMTAKLKTFALMLALGFFMASATEVGLLAKTFSEYWYWGVGFLVLATALAVFSGARYFMYFSRGY